MMIYLKKSNIIFQILRFPLITTTDQNRAKKSRFQWRVEEDGYKLALLGILNTLIGLKVTVK